MMFSAVLAGGKYTVIVDYRTWQWLDLPFSLGSGFAGTQPTREHVVMISSRRHGRSITSWRTFAPMRAICGRHPRLQVPLCQQVF